jgi:HEXXH motif-containing protein
MENLPLTFLAIPRSGERTAAKLAHKVNLIALRQLLTMDSGAVPGRAAESLRKIQFVLQQMVRETPEAVLQVVSQPDVQVPLLVLAARLRPPALLVQRLIPNLLAGLRRHKDLVPEALLWECPVDEIVFEGEGRVSWETPLKALLLDAAGLAVETQSGTRGNIGSLADAVHIGGEAGGLAHGLDSTIPDLHLGLFDTNPLAMDEAHPDKSGNRVSLGDHSIDAWKDTFAEALGLIKSALPTWYEELACTARRVVPVGYEPEMHLSASYREAPRVVYMTLHPDPLTMAEALIHETQHGKMNLLSWLDPVLHNAYSDWCDSPVRSDLRPVMGVLLAVHAFVPVSALHYQLAQMDHPISRSRKFQDRRMQVMEGNAGGLAVVREVAEPSALGKKAMDALGVLNDFVTRGQDLGGAASGAMPPG